MFGPRKRALVLGLAALLLPLGLISTASAKNQDGVAFTAKAMSTYQADGVVWTEATLGGVVYVAGDFNNIRPPGGAFGSTTGNIPEAKFAALDAATGAPAAGACSPGFTYAGGTATIRALEISPDGHTLYVGGLFNHIVIAGVTYSANAYLAAIDLATCTPVAGFHPQPSGLVRTIKAIGGHVYFGGDFTDVNSIPRTLAASVIAVGQAGAGTLTSWAPAIAGNQDTSGKALAAVVHVISAKPDESVILIGGGFNTVNGVPSRALGAVDNTTGTTNIATFGGTGGAAATFPPTSAMKDIAVDSSGFYTGNEGTGGGVFDGRMAFNWATDTTPISVRWKDACLGATQSVVLYQNVLYSASHAHDCTTIGDYADGQRHHFLAESTAANSSGTPDLLPWYPQTNDKNGSQTAVEGIGPRKLAVATKDGKDYMWAVGEFTTVNGAAQQGLTHFGDDAEAAPGTQYDATTSQLPQVTVTSAAPGQVLVAWRPAVDLDDADLTYSVFRDGSTTPVYTTSAYSAFWDRRQAVFVDSTQVPGTTHSYVVRASDGVNHVDTPARSVTVSAVESNYGGQVLRDGATTLLRYDDNNVGERFLSNAAGAGGNFTVENNASGNSGVTYGSTGVTGALGGDPSKAITFPGTAYSSGNTGTFGFSEGRYAPPTGSYTVETWFKTTSTAGGQLIDFGDNQYWYRSTKTDRNLYLTPAGAVDFSFTGAGATQTLTSGTTYKEGNWHLATVSYNSAGTGTTTLYVDGAQKAVKTGAKPTNTWTGFWRIAGDATRIGSNAPAVNTNFNGSLDETALYQSTALTSSQVSNHYALRQAVTDTSAPTAPGNLTATAGSTGITLNWTAATDNKRVAAYEVHRSTVDGFTPTLNSPSTLIASVGSGTTYLDTGALTGTTYYYRVIAVDPAGNQGAASQQAASISTTLDTVPPSTPTGVTATVANADVTVAWTASTDNVGIAGYDVYRGTSSGFTPDVSNKVGGTLGETTYTDAAVAPGNYFYKVVARDTSSNASPPSAAAGAIVQPPSPTQTVVLSPTADSFANAGAPSTIYGADVNLFTQTTSTGTSTSYLRFNLPSPPAGKTLTSVSLNTWTSTADIASSASTQTVFFADDNWDQATMTYQTRPAVQTVPLGSYVPAAVNTAYSADLSAAAFSALTGSTTIAITGGSDSYYGISSNGTPAANRPTLTLVYGPAPAPDTVAPSTPTNVTAHVAGAAVNVAWNDSTDNVGVTGYDVYRSTTAVFSTATATKVGTATTGTTFSDTGATPGVDTYYTVIARDAAQNSSAPATVGPVQVAAPDTTAPSVPGSVSATANGADVSLSWTASTDNVGVAAYDVYRSTTSGSPGTLIGSPTGTTYLDSGRPTGTYYYTVSARDQAGNSSALSSPEASATVVAPPTPTVVTLAPTADSFANSGAPSTKYGGDYSLFTNATSTSFLRFQIPAAPAGQTLTGATLTLHTTTSATASSTSTQSVKDASDSWDESTMTYNTGRPAVGSTVYGTFTAPAVNTVYAVTLDPTQVAALTGSNTFAITGGSDSFYAVSNNGTPAAARPYLTLTYGGTPPAPDSQAPTSPTNVMANVSGSTVNLSWTASTDNVGVVGYRVYRSTSSGTPGTLVGSPTGTSYTDAGLATGTYYYTVAAVDQAGNASAVSSPEASATVTVVSTPTVVTLAPTADSFANSGAPSTKYGGDYSLFTNATSTSFLRFQIPAAPAGKTLTGATLTLHTTTSSTASSTSTQSVKDASDSWDESTMTYNNGRPAVGATVYGTFTAPAVNTVYAVTLDPSAIAALLGSNTLAITGGSDSFYAVSNNGTPAAARPYLTLTYS